MMRSLLFIFFPLFLSSCGFGSSDNVANVNSEIADKTVNKSTIEKNGLRYELSADRFEYDKGEEIKITAKVTNINDEIKVLEFPCDDYFEVAVKNGVDTTKNINTVNCQNELGVINLNADDNIKKIYTWDQTDNENNPVNYATYTINVLLKDSSDESFSPVDVRVVNLDRKEREAVDKDGNIEKIETAIWTEKNIFQVDDEISIYYSYVNRTQRELMFCSPNSCFDYLDSITIFDGSGDKIWCDDEEKNLICLAYGFCYVMSPFSMNTFANAKNENIKYGDGAPFVTSWDPKDRTIIPDVEKGIAGEYLIYMGPPRCSQSIEQIDDNRPIINITLTEAE
ncbi:MAG: hypothetical protein AB1742_08300 [bacterium]